VSRRASCCRQRCGGACINPRFFKCCHQQAIRKNIPCISGHGKLFDRNVRV
jgi:hypothetical protein